MAAWAAAERSGGGLLTAGRVAGATLLMARFNGGGTLAPAAGAIAVGSLTVIRIASLADPAAAASVT